MEPFKNKLSFQVAERIAEALSRAFGKSFQEREFLRDLESELEPLELKARVASISQRMTWALPPAPASYPLLLRTLYHPEGNPLGLRDFSVWPLSDFVAREGLEHLEESLSVLRELTKVFTSEFAIRPYLMRYEAQTLRTLEEWCRDPDEHVRRLVSEGTRPLLPWGQKLSQFVEHPERTWPLLEALRNDPSKYVQKSLANHMNDHSKKHPEWVLRKLRGFENTWIQRHALRTLIKRGHPEALRLVGVSRFHPAVVGLKLFTRKMRLGESVVGEVTLENPRNAKLQVEIDVEFQLLGSRGQTRTKVFKGKKVSLAPSEVRKIEIRTPLRPSTVRAYYPGKQTWSLKINGRLTPEKVFHLVLD